MAQFYPLTVSNIEHTIRDAVVVTLVPDEPTAFEFIQGQYLTFKKDFGGEELRRSYSMCSGRSDGLLQVGIKKVEGGAFSIWANEGLKVGDKIDAMPPMGRFHAELEPNKAKHYLGFAGGSGITPILSILKTVLVAEPESRFTLVYANRAVNSIMFRDVLEDLKNTHMQRLNIIHVLEDDAGEIDLFTGRIDGEKCDRLFETLIDPKTVDTAFICGPEPMMLAIRDALGKHGLSKEQIKYELFASAQSGRAKKRAVSKTEANQTEHTKVRVTLEGENRSYDMSRGTTLLEAALENDLDAPHACKAGVCSTCRARVTEGEVEMVTNHALEDDEVNKGYVLTCQCYPVTEKVAFEFG
jgi:ring-1,2-phenylacetyl-CoA epoxidase subunit PaaE